MSEAETQEIVNNEAEEQQVPENLTLRELDQIAQVIDLASTRGAFRGGELQTVGTLYNKLANFLSFVQAQQNAAAEAAETEDSSDEETEA
jgi:hypothetical protein